MFTRSSTATTTTTLAALMLLAGASLGCPSSEPAASHAVEVAVAAPAEQPAPAVSQAEPEAPVLQPEAAKEPAPLPLAERTPPTIARKKEYGILRLGSWVFHEPMGGWLSKRGLQLAPEGQCPEQVPEVELWTVGKERHPERSWSVVDSFDGLTGDDYEEWLAILARNGGVPGDPDLVLVMFGGKLDDMQTPAGETVSVEHDEGAWLGEYERRLGLLIPLLEPSTRHVLWLGMPDPAATGQVDRPWARIRDAQLRALEASGEPVHYLDMTPYLTDESGQIPKRADVFNDRPIIRLDRGGVFRLSGRGTQWLIQRMTDVVLETLPIRKATRERCGLQGRRDRPGAGNPLAKLEAQAWDYYRAHEYEAAGRLFTQLGEREPEVWKHHHNAACAAALRQDERAAQLALVESLRRGGANARKKAKRDEDLASLHEQPWWSELLSADAAQLAAW